MGHEMTASDQMYSVRIAPWMLGMGTNVEMLDVTPETRMDRMRLSGQDWTVEEHEVYQKLGEEISESGVSPATFEPLEGWKTLVRSDTRGVLNIAKDTYTPIQNVTGHEVFEALSKGAALDDGTGGTTKSGAVCYLSARIDEAVWVNGDPSPIFPYIVVTWAHDGSGAMQARSTSVRVVCWNTVSASEAQSKRAGTNFTFRHTKNVLDRIDEAKLVIAGARSETAEFVELSNELVEIAITDEQRAEFVERFIPSPATTAVISDRVLDNINEARAKVKGIFDSETIPEVHRNTAYGLVTAGVEYLDHLRGYRNADTYLGRTLLRDEPLKARLIPMVRDLVKA